MPSDRLQGPRELQSDYTQNGDRFLVNDGKSTALVQDMIATIDKSGAFKADDEVGKAFQMINDTVKQLEVFGVIQNQGAENEDEKGN